MTGPLTSVLERVEQGSSSVVAIAEETGLPPETVRAAVDHLLRIGRLQAEFLALGCPSGGCAGCSQDSCGEPSAGSGRTSLTLLRRRH